MSPLKEIFWLSKIYKSKGRKRLLGSTPLCKKDYERIAEAPENYKEFSEWFDRLIMEGVFIFAGKINKTNVPANGYVFTEESIDRYIKNNSELRDTYDILNSFFDRERVI